MKQAVERSRREYIIRNCQIIRRANLPPYFCYQVVWENRRDVCAFQGFPRRLGAKRQGKMCKLLFDSSFRGHQQAKSPLPEQQCSKSGWDDFAAAKRHIA